MSTLLGPINIKMKDTDEGIEEVICTSDMNKMGEDVVKDVGLNAETTKILYCHLRDHDYFLKRKKPKERSIKITELRAVFNCKRCGYRTMNRELFSKHSCGMKPGYVPCTKCNTNTIPEGYEKCTKCTYFTKNKSSLKVHMRIHAKGTPYKCTECSFSGKDLKDLIIHYEEVKDLKCECGYATHVKQQMVTHKRSHTGEKPFACGICSYSSADRAALHRHLKKHEEPFVDVEH